MEIGKYVSPYWSAAELLRYAAVAFDTKRNSQGNVAKQLDEYVSSGYYQHEKNIRLVEAGIIEPAARVFALTGEIKKDFFRLLQTDLFKFFDDYHKLIGEVCGVGHSRELMNKFVAGIVTRKFHDLLIRQYNLIVGVHTVQKVFLKRTAVETVFSWIESAIPSAIADFRQQPGYEPSTEAKWKSGEDVPLLMSLRKLVECVASHSSDRQLTVSVCHGLLFARGIDFLLKDTGHRNLEDFIKISSESLDGKKVLEEIRGATWADIKRFQSYTPLFKALSLPNADRTFSIEEFNIIFREIYEYNAAEDCFGTFQSLPMWVKGKFHLLCGEIELARDYYKKAFEYSIYLGGNLPIEILEEAIVVAAVGKRPDRPFLKKLKNQGIALGLYNYFEVEQPDSHIGIKKSRAKDSFIEDWEIDQLNELFFVKFPPETFFDERYVEQFEGTLPIFIDVQKNAKPYLQKPNKVIQVSAGRSKRFPQLVYYSMMNDLEGVKALLHSGADLNRMTQEGESALFFGIQHMNLAWFPPVETPAPELFDVLYDEAERLYQDKSQALVEMVNTPLLKRKFTLLHCAIETGEPSVVRKVLRLGANVDQKSGLDQQTPLYICLQTLFRKQYPEKYHEKMAFNLPFCPPKLMEDVKRRWAGPLPINMPEGIQKRAQNVTNKILDDCYQRFDPEKLYEIAELLLEYGANPNAICDFASLKNFTPLMYAIEYDDMRLYEIFMQYGGDTTLKCYSPNNDTWYSCRDVAWRWGAKDILEII